MNKTIYEMPTVERIPVAVEKGFAASPITGDVQIENTQRNPEEIGWDD